MSNQNKEEEDDDEKKNEQKREREKKNLPTKQTELKTIRCDFGCCQKPTKLALANET